MSNPYSAFDLAALETLRDRYVARGDGARAAQVREAITATGSKQTDELYNSGRIFAVERPRDATGRVIVEHHGDPMAWMQHFCGAGAVGMLNVSLAQQAARKQGRAG